MLHGVNVILSLLNRCDMCLLSATVIQTSTGKWINWILYTETYIQSLGKKALICIHSK